MTDSNKTGFYSVLVLIFLLPIFFIPSQLIPLGIAKSVLIFIAAFVGFGSLIVHLFKSGRLSLPRTKLLWGALVLPLAYLVSALGSSTQDLSLFGYGFELGTAGSVILASTLFLVASLVFRDRSRLVRGYAAIFLSLALLSLFVLIKILSGGTWLTFGMFSGIMGNPIGAWTDIAAALSALVILATFALEMLPLGRALGVLTWAVFALSILMLSFIGFSTMWALLLGAGLVLLVYFVTVEKNTPEEGASKKQGIWAAAILSLIALIFVWNPTFSTRSLSQTVSESVGISNVDIRPSLSATLSVGRSVLGSHPILGSGPSTFDKEWLLYKSPAVNTTAFWNTAFPFGFGFLPTAIATTGIVGIVSWIFFLALFIMLGVSILSRSPERRADRFIALSAFLIALFLWLANFLFVPSIVFFVLAFVFTGFAVGAAEATGIISTLDIDLHRGKLSRFISALVMLVLVVGALGLGRTMVKKVLAAAHFEKALAYANSGETSADTIEGELAKAVMTSENDQYWTAVSQVELARANAALANASSTDSERQVAFQDALSKSIAAIQNAIKLNPTYSNWVMLGNLYESLVPAPLAINGAYENALSAYQSAKALHPASPEIALLLARLELDNKNVDAARTHVDEALALKNDYADAYFFLSQLEISQNNLAEAIRNAETGVILTPNNAGVLFELGLLKYSAKDYAGAAEALAAALQISPDYANAKYYLGLTLDKLGKKNDAIAQFEDLAKTNPDNEAVAQVLTNLKAGRDALAETPASTQKPKTAPISGQ